MSASYELTSLEDIFVKVPTERIQDCCREIGQCLAQTKAMQEFYEACGGKTVGIQWPINWVDDHAGNVTTAIGVRGNGGEFQEILRLDSKPIEGDE